MFFNKKVSGPVFFEEDAETLDAKFEETMRWMRGLSRKDFNRVKKAIDLDYDAFNALHGIELDDEGVEKNSDPKFILHEKEGE